MAKEWDKFQATYKKIEPKLKIYTEANGAKKSAILSNAYSNCSVGENNITDSIVTARENGITGNELKGFMKDKGFQEAMKLYTLAVNEMDTAQKDYGAFCAAARGVADEVATLHAAIEKDLKGRKDKSESKKEIEGLRDQLGKDWPLLDAVAKRNTKNTSPAKEKYVENYQKTIDTLLKEAPEEQQRKKDESELPQLLVDRNIKSNFSKAVGMVKRIDEHCAAALEASEEDLKAAAPHLKLAVGELSPLKKLSDSYEEVAKRFDANIQNSKDEAKIRKMIGAITKGFADSDRKIRGIATTIKKAG